jgi:ParB-like chromosome segregation protein Spo0J
MTIAHLTSSIVFQSPNALRPHPRNARTHPKRQIKQVADSIKAFGHLVPILIDEAGFVLAGHARLAAAKLIGLQSVPTIVASGLTDAQKRAFMIADNKLTQNAGWDRQMLAVEIGELSIQLPSLDLDISVTGFEAGEIDVLLSDMGDEKSEPEDILPPDKGIAVTRRGDLWLLGPHRVLCGDAREQSDYARLMNGDGADMVFTDPPYNVPVAGHVQGRGQVRHAEFAFASGEMSEGEFRAFPHACLGHAASVSREGCLHFVCMDWRHIGDLIEVGGQIYPAMINLVVWNKSNAGQGSFYRSQHELIAVFRTGEGAHQNNIELGKHGRNRSNVWNYPGVNSFGAGRDDALAMHPTVKPVALVADAMRDCTSKGDLILDGFLGSGTTMMAAEKIGRRCNAIEYEPTYVDVAIRRWQAYSKKDAVLDGDGRTFDEIAAARRKADAPPAVLLQGHDPVKNETGADAGADAEDWIALCNGDDAHASKGQGASK